MNKAIAIFAFVFLLSLGFAADSHAGSSMAKMRLTEYGTTQLLGLGVNTPNGEELGRIFDLEIDPQGHITFALVVQNGFEDFPGRVVAVPFSALTITKTKSQEIQVVLNVDKEKFYTAPNFSAKNLDNRKWAAEVYRFFGQQPYWIEEEVGNLCADPYALLEDKE